MTRETSIEAYSQIQEEGLLGKLQFTVYDAIYQYGPATQGELWAGRFEHIQKTVFTPRFAELEQMGVIRTVGERPCNVSGRKCLVWDVTSSTPDKTEKKESKDKTIQELHGKIKELESRLQKIHGCLFCKGDV